mmetsp:Transcript_7608/g.11194  ORF Transcript_7608/g.11194 Transcript_7608/m.11194 type:complete len:236 (-) Transcript_7608:65-772(-)
MKFAGRLATSWTACGASRSTLLRSVALYFAARRVSAPVWRTRRRSKARSAMSSGLPRTLPSAPTDLLAKSGALDANPSPALAVRLSPSTTRSTPPSSALALTPWTPRCHWCASRFSESSRTASNRISSASPMQHMTASWSPSRRQQNWLRLPPANMLSSPASRSTAHWVKTTGGPVLSRTLPAVLKLTSAATTRIQFLNIDWMPGSRLRHLRRCSRFLGNRASRASSPTLFESVI